MAWWDKPANISKGLYRIITDDRVQGILKVIPITAPVGVASEKVEGLIERLQGVKGKPDSTLGEKVDEIHAAVMALLKAKIAEQEAKK